MENLKKLRTQKKVSQSEMAKVVNMSVRGYQNIEYGVNEASYTILNKLADYFGCSIDYLLGHQTNSIIQLEMLTQSQREAIDLVKTLNDKEAYSVVGYINHMRGEPLNDLVEKILNEGRK